VPPEGIHPAAIVAPVEQDQRRVVERIPQCRLELGAPRVPGRGSHHRDNRRRPVAEAQHPDEQADRAKGPEHVLDRPARTVVRDDVEAGDDVEEVTRDVERGEARPGRAAQQDGVRDETCPLPDPSAAPQRGDGDRDQRGGYQQG